VRLKAAANLLAELVFILKHRTVGGLTNARVWYMMVCRFIVGVGTGEQRSPYCGQLFPFFVKYWKNI